MSLLLAALVAPLFAGNTFDLTVAVGPDGPSDSRTVEAEIPGLLYSERLQVSERQQVEFQIYLDERLPGEQPADDRFRFSAEIYRLTLNRRGEERRRELVSQPRIVTRADEPARLVQGARHPDGEIAYELKLEVTPRVADAR